MKSDEWFMDSIEREMTDEQWMKDQLAQQWEEERKKERDIWEAQYAGQEETK
jgi:hypothetical protein